jgi:hypothetical protein
MTSWDQAHRGEKLGVVWRNGRLPLLTVLAFNYFMVFRLRGMRECERELTGRQPFTDLTQVSRHVRSVPAPYIPDFYRVDLFP